MSELLKINKLVVKEAKDLSLISVVKNIPAFEAVRDILKGLSEQDQSLIPYILLEFNDHHPKFDEALELGHPTKRGDKKNQI